MQVTAVVDHFHFKSHKGAYCHQHTKPYDHTELKGGANLSVCEQRFKYIAQHQKRFRYMNQARFNFMLAMWFGWITRPGGMGCCEASRLLCSMGVGTQHAERFWGAVERAASCLRRNQCTGDYSKQLLRVEWSCVVMFCSRWLDVSRGHCFDTCCRQLCTGCACTLIDSLPTC